MLTQLQSKVIHLRQIYNNESYEMQRLILALLLLITTNINAKDLYLNCNGSVGKFVTDYIEKSNSSAFN